MGDWIKDLADKIKEKLKEKLREVVGENCPDAATG